MELTNGTVTNGLLAVELMSGMIQGGDAQFDRKFGPAIPIAGDEDNPGPTYASVGGGAKYLFDSTPNQSGGVTTITLTAAGQRMDSPLGASPGTTFAAYDDATKHNVTQAFAAFRELALFHHRLEAHPIERSFALGLALVTCRQKTAQKRVTRAIARQKCQPR